MPSTTRQLIVLVLLLCASCLPAEDPDMVATVIDSAGVGIALNPAGLEPPPWALDDTPLLHLAGDEAGHEPFFRPRGVTPLHGGGFAVANGGTSEILFYDDAGVLQRRVGRSGEGPGEYRSISWLTRLPGDTLAVFDGPLQRLTLLEPSGALLSTSRVVPPADPAPAGPFAFFMGGAWGILADRTLPGVGRQIIRIENRAGPRSVRSALVRVDTAGALLDTVALFHVSSLWETEPGSPRRFENLPFARAAQVAVGDDRIYLSRNDRRIIEVLDPTGRKLRSIRDLRPLVPVTPEDLAAWRSREMEDRPPDAPELTAEPPDSFPAYRDLLVDDRGRIWAADYSWPSEAAREWRVFGPDGVLVGGLRTPAGFDVHAIQGDRIYGVWRDALDVPYIRAYRFQSTVGE